MGKVNIENRLNVIVRGAKSILENQDFEKTARTIFDYCREMTGAKSGYVALLSDTGEENEVLFLEAGGLPCDVDPELPMPIRGLREEAYKTHKAVYDNDFMNSRWVEYLPEGHVNLKNVMFAPLNLENKTVGIIGLANKKGNFTDDDAEIASILGDLAAIALKNSRYLEALSQKTADLEHALAEIKTLKGIIPICMHCKEIRNDEGYWIQIEKYITSRSDAEFSHSVCDKCVEKHYPEMLK